jgi:drug/metabolite transporter (DMT)-like permease
MHSTNAGTDLKSSHATVHAGLFVTALAWGLNVSAVKALTSQVDVMLVASLRTVLAAAALTVLVFLHSRAVPSLSPRLLAWALTGATLMVYANQALFAHGMARTSATNGALIMALAPLVCGIGREEAVPRSGEVGGRRLRD